MSWETLKKLSLSFERLENRQINLPSFYFDLPRGSSVRRWREWWPHRAGERTAKTNMSREGELTKRKRQSGIKTANVGSALTAWPAPSTCFCSTELLNKWLPAGNKGIFHSSIHNWKQIQVVTFWTNKDARSQRADLWPPAPLLGGIARAFFLCVCVHSGLAAVRAHFTTSSLRLRLLVISCELGAKTCER